MGHAIERIARQRGHEIVAIIDIDNPQDVKGEAFKSADVAIEFTTPATAVVNYMSCFAAGVPVVSGSTGWTARMDEVKQKCLETGGTFLWTSNFSVGVNLFFRLNRYLTKLMNPFPQYHPAMMEVHHVHKLDHPSGTAITLAEGIIDESTAINSWSEDKNSTADTLVIDHEREGEVPGTHIISWDSPVDTITIEHKAKSREGFALGAVIAAEWTCGRKGVLTMEQMMNDILTSI